MRQPERNNLTFYLLDGVNIKFNKTVVNSIKSIAKKKLQLKKITHYQLKKFCEIYVKIKYIPKLYQQV